MPLPQILTHHAHPIGGLPPPGTVSVTPLAPGGAPLPVNSFPFVMQRQLQTNWCWAAVATSVSHYYNPASAWTQCLLANSELGQTSCCANGATPACNIPYKLDSALTRTGNLRSMSATVETYANVQLLVAAREPLGVRIGWSGGGGHFVAVRGYATLGTNQFVDVEDPIHGSSTVQYADLCSRYQGAGTWTHSYRTQP